MTRKAATLDELKVKDLENAGPLTNGDEPVELVGEEYAVEVEVEGKSPLLMHRWDSQAVADKAAASKGSKAKKSDNLESYVYRDADGYLSIPGRAIAACLREAARSMQDPRSPRKSLRDLVKASLLVEPLNARIQPETKEWHYIDRQRVLVQRAAITRERPAIREGWSLKFTVVCLAGEYINQQLLHDLITRSGRFVGLLDGRPEYGQFRVVSFKRVVLKP
jgi:hypothetical protein